jgi:inositol transport system substrate-binding protein
VVYLKGASGNQAAEARWEGFKKYCLDKRSDVKLLAFADAQWSTAEAMKDMSLWLDMFPKIDGVICGNDGMAMGAIAALKGAGRLSGVLVSGVDATDDALAAIKAGEMAQTVKQDAKGQAEGVFKLVQQAMQGQKPENILVPFTAITRENVSQFAK